MPSTVTAWRSLAELFGLPAWAGPAAKAVAASAATAAAGNGGSAWCSHVLLLRGVPGLRTPESSDRTTAAQPLPPLVLRAARYGPVRPADRPISHKLEWNTLNFDAVARHDEFREDQHRRMPEWS